MSALIIAWWVSFLVTVMVLPVGVLRMVAIGSGGFERSRTMRISAHFALGLGLVGLLVTIVLGIVVLTR